MMTADTAARQAGMTANEYLDAAVRGLMEWTGEDGLDQIAAAAAEDEHMARERVLLQRLLGLRRMSVTPAASQTRVFAGTGIMQIAHGSAGPVLRGRSHR